MAKSEIPVLDHYRGESACGAQVAYAILTTLRRAIKNGDLSKSEDLPELLRAVDTARGICLRHGIEVD